MGTHWHFWGPLMTYGDLREPVGSYAGLWGPMGTFWDLWGPTVGYGHLRTYGDL